MAISNPFLWGSAGRKMTPEQVARERERASAMLEGVGDVSPVGHWTQGLGRVVNAITGKIQDRRADASEQLGLDSADEYIASNPVLASLIGGSPVTTFGGSDMPPLNRSGGGGSSVGFSAPGADGIREGLVQRGLPPHVADAFVLNFRDESGLDPSINEHSPLVPGSRGGFGLSQWTGPRRVALERFAADRGTPVDDIDTQLDYLVSELQGPEQAAAQAILSSPDTPTAAAAIVNRFLRPAEEHRARREAAYLGGGGGASPALSAAQGQQAGVVEALSGAMANPWVAQKYGPVIEALMDQQMRRGDMAYEQQLREADPMYQAQLAQLTNPQSSLPSTAQTLQWRAEQAGLVPGTPEYQQFMLSGGGGGGDESAAEAKIARLTNDLIESGDITDPQLARSMAVGITDGRFKLDRHPLEGTAQIVDMATGRVMYDGRNPATPETLGEPAQVEQVGQAEPESYTFGDEAAAGGRDAGRAFGVEGFATTQLNRLTDTLGLGQAYPDVAGTKADFDVLRERLISDIAAAYGRQPPSWLLRNISDLSPSAGSLFQGAEDAQNKLRSVVRSFDQEISTTKGQLGGSLSPNARQELELRLSTLEASKSRVENALGWFRSDEPEAEDGKGMDGWTVEEIN